MKKSLLSILENELSSIRLFTFGIGSGIDDFMINRMAESGRGQSRFILDARNIASEVTDLFNTLNTPVLTDIELTFFDANNTPLELLSFPYPVKDLFLNHPVQASYRSENGTPTRVELIARRGNQTIHESFPIEYEENPHPGIEFLFARKWIDQIQAEIYRAETENERAALRDELTEIAVLFQIVTEFTSRVAVEEFPESTPSNNQFSTASYSSDEDLFVLSPFEVDTSQDTGWRSTNSTSGCSLNTAIKDIPMSIEVINADFLSDIAANSFDEALSYSAGVNIVPEQEAYTGNNFNTDQHNSLTPVDMHTVGRIEIQNSPTVRLFNALSPFKTSNILQKRPLSVQQSDIGLSIGNDNYRETWIDHNQPLGGHQMPAARLIASRIDKNRTQDSALLSGEFRSDATSVSTNLSLKSISDFGRFKRTAAEISQNLGENIYATYSYSHNEIDLDSGPRFLITDTATELFDFPGATQLYSTTNFDQQTEEEHQLRTSADIDTDKASHKVTLSLQHLDRNESIAPLQSPKSEIESNSKIRSLAYAYNLSLLDETLRITIGQKSSKTQSDHLEKTQSNLSSNLGLSWDLTDEITLRYNYANAEESNALFQQSYQDPFNTSRSITPSSLPTSIGTGHDIGAAFDFFDRKISGNLLFFQATEHNTAYRDWASESDLNQQYKNQELNLQSPAIYSIFSRTEHEGLALNLNLSPIQTFSLILNAYTDWADQSPTKGDKTKISTFCRYTFTEGFLKGFRVGGGLRYRDRVQYNDGYNLPKHLLLDILIDYEFKIFGSTKTKLSLNLKNLTEDTYQQTRFTTPKGLQSLITLKTEF